MLGNLLGGTRLTYRQLREASPKDMVQLFPLQQQMFDFLDGASQRAPSQPEDDGELDLWLPFSIELDSEATVLRELDQSGSTFDSILRSGPSIFRRPSPQQGDTKDVSRMKPSEQQRFFVAIRRSFVFVFHASVPVEKQHLYEVLREGTPCQFYLDVEQELEFTETSEYRRDDCGPTTEESQSAPNAHCCPWNCHVKPSHEQTTEVLLRTLERYLLTRKDLGGLCMKHAEIVVMRSVPMAATSSTATKPFKFSQHYVVHFRDTVFQDNRHVGSLVRDYVEWLFHLSVDDPLIHSSLFFHAEPIPAHHRGSEHSEQEVVLMTNREGSAAAPVSGRQRFLMKKCIIDLSVYSRNRMFRCFGSSKLGKSAVMVLDSYCTGVGRLGSGNSFTAPTDADFHKTLIASHAASNVIRLDTASPSGRLSLPAAQAGVRAGPSSRMLELPSPYPLVDNLVREVILKLPGTARASITHFYAFSSTSGDTASSADAGTVLVYHVTGTRYCHRVRREHKSNAIYYVASIGAATIVQRCFDPDCQHFRSDPVRIPFDALRTVPSAPNEPYYMVDAQVALTHSQSMRTMITLKRPRLEAEQ